MRDIFLIKTDLRDADWQTRREAVKELHRGGDPRAIPLFGIMLGDVQAEVRQAAAEALAELGDLEAVEALVGALEDKDAYVRYYAAIALGRIGFDEAREPLARRLRDPFPFVREKAAWALGELGDPEAVPALIRMLQRDSYLSNQAAAALALGRLGAEEQLLEMARGDDPFASAHAQEVLLLLAGVSGREPAKVNSEFKIQNSELDIETISGREPGMVEVVEPEQEVTGGREPALGQHLPPPEGPF